jgi:type IV pilus assembly protein PilE
MIMGAKGDVGSRKVFEDDDVIVWEFELAPGDTTPCQDTTASNRTFGVFVVDCAAVSATAFQLRATGSAPAAGFVFTLDERDQRATTSAASGWPTCASRWLTRKGDTC